MRRVAPYPAYACVRRKMPSLKKFASISRAFRGSLYLLLLACLAPGSAAAGRLDQDDARRLYRSGAILPLEQVLEVVRGYQPGRVIEVELDEDSRRYVYELEILAPDGRVWELEVDAATGRLLERKRED